MFLLSMNFALAKYLSLHKILLFNECPKGVRYLLITHFCNYIQYFKIIDVNCYIHINDVRSVDFKG